MASIISRNGKYCVVIPYENEIKKWQIANGGKPLISQIDSIKNAGLTDDAEQTYKTIQEENRMEAENRMGNILESEMVM